MKKIFLIDNYDSFTYNLSHYLEELGCDVTVKRNDMFELEEISNEESWSWNFLNRSKPKNSDKD